MEIELCDACGREIESASTVKHRIVPEEVAKLYGILDSRTITLCLECSSLIHDWYLKKVSTITYDSAMKRFRARTPAEIVHEYESAYSGFVKFRKERKKQTKRS